MRHSLSVAGHALIVAAAIAWTAVSHVFSGRIVDFCWSYNNVDD